MRIGPFRLGALCCAHVFSTLGWELGFFLALLHVYRQGSSVAGVSLFTVVSYLPRFAAPFLGWLVDRFPKEWVLALSLLAGGGLLALLPWVSSGVPALTSWCLFSACGVLASSARTALVVRTLPPENRGESNSAMMVSLNAAKLFAPLAGGLMSAKLDFSSGMLLVAGIYVLAAVLALGSPKGREEEVAKGSPGAIFRGLQEGIILLWELSPLRFLLLAGILWRFFLGCQVGLFVVYVAECLGGTNAQYGFFMTLIGVGSLIGARAATGLSTKTSVGLGLGIHFALSALLGLLHSFPAALVTASLGSGAFYVGVVVLHTQRDRFVPPAFRGRVYGAASAALCGATVISMMLGGWLASLLGVKTVLLLTGLGALVSLAALLLRMPHPFADPGRVAAERI
jgi:MFS family permease